MDEIERQPVRQKPSSKNLIIAISVIIGGGLAIGLGVGLGVGLNNVETVDVSQTLRRRVEMLETQLQDLNSTVNREVIQTLRRRADTLETQELNSTVNSEGQSGNGRGEPGVLGPQGPPSRVDYDVVNREIQRQVDISLGGLTAKIDEMNAKLERFSEAEKSLCPIFYNGTCFRLFVKSVSAQTVNHQQGKELCQNSGWKLANIYDLTHFQMIATYVRSRIEPSQTALNAWIGMTWDIQTRQASYSTGDRAPLTGIQWYPGFPESKAQFTKMGIYFTKDASHTHQGIYNFPPNYTRHGALCELPSYSEQ